MTDMAMPPALTFRPLRSADAEAAFAVHHAATHRLTNDIVRRESREFICGQIGDGFVLGGFAESGSLVAYGALMVAVDETDKIADMLELDVANRARFCLLDGTAVHPDWQRRGIHKAMIAARLDHARNLGQDLVGVTVSPRNMKSFKNLLNAGFCIEQAGLLYGGYERLILLRDLRGVLPSFVRSASVLAENFAQHRDAIKTGLAGFELSLSDQGLAIIQYGRPVAEK